MTEPRELRHSTSAERNEHPRCADAEAAGRRRQFPRAGLETKRDAEEALARTLQDLRGGVEAEDRLTVPQVSPNLYGACIDLRDQQVVLTFFVAPDLSDDERHDLYAAVRWLSPTALTITRSRNASWRS